jgi:hypothetical protein
MSRPVRKGVLDGVGRKLVDKKAEGTARSGSISSGSRRSSRRLLSRKMTPPAQVAARPAGGYLGISANIFSSAISII